MKKFKVLKLIMVCSFIFAMISPVLLPINDGVIVVQAATVKLNKKTLTLTEGKSATLTLSGNKKSVKWSSSKKSVATVSQKGKVTAKKAGTAKITATVGKNKYVCQVTVKAKVVKNPLITNAPFTAKETIIGDFSAVIPKDWTNMNYNELPGLYLIYPTSADLTKGTSNITITTTATATKATEYSIFKEILAAKITKEYITNALSTQLGITDLEITNFKTSDTDTKLGTAFTTEFSYVYNGITMNQRIYDVSIDNYIIEVTTTDIGDSVSPDVKTVAEYILNSFKLNK